MKSLHGVLHGRLWIRVHGLPEFALGLPPKGGSNKKKLVFFPVGQILG